MNNTENTENFKKIIDTDSNTEGLQLPDNFDSVFKKTGSGQLLMNAAKESFSGLDSADKQNILTQANNEILERSEYPTDDQNAGNKRKIAVLYMCTSLVTGNKHPLPADVKNYYNKLKEQSEEEQKAVTNSVEVDKKESDVVETTTPNEKKQEVKVEEQQETDTEEQQETDTEEQQETDTGGQQEATKEQPKVVEQVEQDNSLKSFLQGDKYNSLPKKIKRKINDIVNIQDKKDKLVGKSDALNKEIDDLDKEIQGKNDEISVLNSQIKELSGDISGVKKLDNKDTRRNNIKELNKKREKASERIFDIELERNRLIDRKISLMSPRQAYIDGNIERKGKKIQSKLEDVVVLLKEEQEIYEKDMNELEKTTMTEELKTKLKGDIAGELNTIVQAINVISVAIERKKIRDSFKNKNYPRETQKTIDVVEAEALASEVPVLVLNGLKEISTEVAEKLAEKSADNSEEYLVLNGLTTISTEVAEKLANGGKNLILNGLTTISTEVAEKLTANGKNGKRDLVLNGLTTISTEVAEKLTANREIELILNGLTTISTEVAEKLATHKGKLELMGLENMSNEITHILSNGKGRVFISLDKNQ